MKSRSVDWIYKYPRQKFPASTKLLIYFYCRLEIGIKHINDETPRSIST